MTQRPNGRGPLPAKEMVKLGDLLPTEQYVAALKPIAVTEENLPDRARSAPESSLHSTTRLTINEQGESGHQKLLGLDPDVTKHQRHRAQGDSKANCHQLHLRC